MKRMTWSMAGAACLAVLGMSIPAKAMLPAPAPIQQRVAMVDLVVVGKLGKVEAKNVSALPVPGAKDKVEYQVLSLEVGEALAGKPGKTLRLGFIPPQLPRPPAPGGPAVLGKPFRGLIFSTGQEGVFFLTKHHAEDFYVAANYFDFIDRKAPTFNADLDLVKRCVKLLQDPDKSLESKVAEDRLITAAMLLARYRNPKAGPMKQEPIDAAQSKRILQILADADWNVAPKPGQPFGYQIAPQQLFYSLGAQEKDGWKPPKEFKEFPDAAKAWLRANVDRFRIQRYVVDKKD